MGPLPSLINETLLLARTAFALFSGPVSADNNGLLRKDEPMTYWLVMIGLLGASFGLFVTAYHLGSGS